MADDTRGASSGSTANVEPVAYAGPPMIPGEPPDTTRGQPAQDTSDKGIPAYAQEFTSEEARQAVEFDTGPEGQRGRIVAPLEVPEQPPPPSVDLSGVKPDESGGQVATIGKQRYYLPGSTMYGIGYATVEQYEKDEPAYVLKDVVDGQPILITQAEELALYKLHKSDPKKYIDQLELMGIIPAGSVYVEGKGDDIRYVSGEAQRQMQAGSRAESEQRQAQMAFVRDVLPTMPEEYQKAYKAKDAEKLEELETQYRKEHNDWINDNIKSDSYLSGILAGKGELAAIAAWEKRQTDVTAIFERQQEKQRLAEKTLSDAGFTSELPTPS
jgi:hypothetical protein